MKLVLPVIDEVFCIHKSYNTNTHTDEHTVFAFIIVVSTKLSFMRFEYCTTLGRHEVNWMLSNGAYFPKSFDDVKTNIFY